MNSSVIEEKTMEFAVRIVNLYKYLIGIKNEYVISKQILRCGTSIGANVAEGERGQTKPDFKWKMVIALNGANETRYWLMLLFRTAYLTRKEFDSLDADIKEIIAILTAICKTTNERSAEKSV